MKLLHKLSLLVLLPILFEFLFVGMLAYFQERAEHDRQVYAHAQAITHVLDEMSREYYDIGSAAALYGSTHENAFLERYNVLRDNLLGSVSSLESLLAGDQALSGSVEKISTLVKRSMREMDSFFSGERITLDTKTLRSHLRTASEVGTYESKKIADAQAEVLRAGPEREAQWRKSVHWLLFAAALSSLVLTVILLKGITAGIVNRVSTIVANTERILVKETLKEPVSGNDEIAILDRFVHQMARKLSESDALRKEFIGMVTHDVRAPLTNVRFLFGMISEGMFDDEAAKLKSRIDAIQPELERVNRLIEDLLFLDKLEAMNVLEPLPVQADEVLSAACDSLRETADVRGIELICNQVDLELIADKDRLTQVLINLVSNAIAVSPPGSRIELQALRKNDALEFSVADQGPGVADKDKTIIFDRFVQSDHSQPRSGFGLGLAICKRLVELQGGTIGVRRRDGQQGSEFWFQIPTKGRYSE